MINHKKFQIGLAGVLLAVLTISGNPALAAGFEKSVLWSGKWTALGGAAASSVSGPDALYFNPAGLGGSTGLQINLNGAATGAQFQAPLVPGQGTVNDTSQFLLPFAGFVSYGVTSHFTVGAGIYVGGGTKAEYDNISWSSLNSNLASLTTTDRASLSITEVSVGAGYEIIDGLKVGVGYRILLGNLDLQYSGAQPIVAGSGQYSVAQYNMLGMSGTRFNGFRAGLQYAPKDSRWGVGAEFRSAVNFTLTNNAVSASVLVPAAGITSPASLTGGQGAVTNSAPMNVSIGAHFDIIPATWRVMGEYTFTQYHDNVSLGVSASVVNPLTGTTVFPDIYQGWNNMHNLRFGTEYKLASDLALRAGYVWTSQVVPNSYANPLFEAPSFGNTVAIGAGKQILANLTLDGALEYSWANGTVATTDLPAATTLTGNYVTSAYAFHLGASLAF